MTKQEKVYALALTYDEVLRDLRKSWRIVERTGYFMTASEEQFIKKATDQAELFVNVLRRSSEQKKKTQQSRQRNGQLNDG